MRDLSLHLLDLAQNSITAGADLVTIRISVDTNGWLEMVLKDDGKGMSPELLQRGVSLLPGKLLQDLFKSLLTEVHRSQGSPGGAVPEQRILKDLFRLPGIRTAQRRIQPVRIHPVRNFRFLQEKPKIVHQERRTAAARCPPEQPDKLLRFRRSLYLFIGQICLCCAAESALNTIILDHDTPFI